MRGRWVGWRLVVAVVAVAAGLALPVVPASAAAGPGERRPGDPRLSVDRGAVEAAMVCRGPVDGGGRKPVLLVHGSFFSGTENYGWNYLPELAARGYRACTVELPNRSIDDIQVAAEHVVVAVHRLARETGRQVDLLAHSQGVLQARWAVKWWPSVQAQVDDLVGLAGPNQGTTVAASPAVALGGCQACLQMAPGSAFLTALNAGDQSPGDVSYTSIYTTLVDELIVPNATAPLIEGASNLELQALCPGRPVTHVSIVADTAAHALVLDAFTQPGPASAARFSRATCRQTTFVGLPGTLGGVEMLLGPHTPPMVGTIPATEPPLKPYARRQSEPTSPASRPAPRSTTSTTPAARAVAPPPAPAAPAPVARTVGSAAAPAPAPAAVTARPAGTSRAGEPGLLLLAVAALAVVSGGLGGIAARRARADSTAG